MGNTEIVPHVPTPMDDVIWKFSVPLFPVNFKHPGRVLLKYLQSHVDRYVSDLDGLLISFQKSTVHLLTSNSSSGVTKQALIPMHPELTTIQLRAQVMARVFSPRIGQELTATVSNVQSHMVICKTDAPNVTVTITRCSETGESSFYHSTIEKTVEDDRIKLNADDVVKVRVSAISAHPKFIILRADLLTIVSNAAQISKALVKKFVSSSSSDEGDISASNSSARVVKSKKNKKRHTKPEEESRTEKVALGNTSLKRSCPEDDGGASDEVEIKIEDDSPPRKKSKHHSKSTALPHSSNQAEVDSEDYKPDIDTLEKEATISGQIDGKTRSKSKKSKHASNKADPE